MASMKWYQWLWVPLLVLAAIVAYMIGKSGNVADGLATEIEALTARADAKREIADKDHAAAAEAIERRYQDKIARLNYDEASIVARLRSDPVALADWLARI